ncbi:MAG TPA: hypothetical protein VFK72_09050, partial [Nevskia sp.]|nr:hypothetical protein [Nevskia sp.]
MAKKHKAKVEKSGSRKEASRDKGNGKSKSRKAVAEVAATASPRAELSGKEYAREMRKLHEELVKLQQ